MLFLNIALISQHNLLTALSAVSDITGCYCPAFIITRIFKSQGRNKKRTPIIFGVLKEKGTANAIPSFNTFY